jgi:ABC-type glycerol-3-phosphate transport system substrate-binding protein
LLRTLLTEGLAPAALLDFHYDEAHKFFRNGRAAMICDWPGYFGHYSDPALSAVAGRFAVARMPAGPCGSSLAYGGSHTFALTRHGAENPAAVSLLEFLTAPEQQLRETAQGSVPVRRSVMDRVRGFSEPSAATRWQLLEDTIQNHVLIPPKLSYYPEIEDILWHSVQDAISGRMEIDAALAQMESRIAERVREHGRESPAG